MISKLITVVVLGGFVTVSVAMYLLPVLIGWMRHVPDLGVIAVVDILLGWTFFGWVVALALALRSVNRGGPVVQVVQNLPQSPQSQPFPPSWAGQQPGAGWAGPPGPPPGRAEAVPPLVLPPRPAAHQEGADRG